jgi:hypothetical protein
VLAALVAAAAVWLLVGWVEFVIAALTLNYCVVTQLTVVSRGNAATNVP